MADPVKVTVTGAAGPDRLRAPVPDRQRPDARPRHAGRSCSLLEIPDAVKAAEGTAMELDDCAFPLLRRDRHHRRPQAGLRRLQRRRCWSAPARAARAWSAPTCSRPTAASSSPRARRSTPAPPTTCKVLVVGNPANTNCLIAMSNAPDVPRERFTAMMRLDHNRAIAQLANKLGAPVSRGHQHDRLGQPLDHPVPRPRQRQGRRRERLGRGRRRGLDRRRVHPHGWPSAAPRSSRRAAPPAPPRPPTRRSTTSTTGCSARRRATGSRWRVPSDGSYGVEEGIVSRLPLHLLAAASGRSSRASRSTTSRASGSTPASTSCARSATRSASSAWSRAAGRGTAERRVRSHGRDFESIGRQSHSVGHAIQDACPYCPLVRRASRGRAAARLGRRVLRPDFLTRPSFCRSPSTR